MCITAFSVVVGVIVSNVNNQANGDRYVPYWLHKICYALSGLCCVSMITWEERHCNVKKLRQVGLFVFYQPSSVHGGLWPSSSLSTVCVVPLRGDWAIFCHAGSGRVGRVRSAREKSLEILRRGLELNPGHGEDRQWTIPLSYHGWQ